MGVRFGNNENTPSTSNAAHIHSIELDILEIMLHHPTAFSSNMLNASIKPKRALCIRWLHNTMRIMYIYLPSHDQANNAQEVV